MSILYIWEYTNYYAPILYQKNDLNCCVLCDCIDSKKGYIFQFSLCHKIHNMLQIIPAKDRYFSDMGNMNSHFLFSFADYYDPQNESFGNLRVFNDDFLKANSGFGMHPHHYYEIMTIMLAWTITHKDSLWNHMKITKNQIQVTDTSTGIRHSEINEWPEDLNLYQIWFAPEKTASQPIYYTANFEETDFTNTLFTLASGINEDKNVLSSQVSVKRWIFDANQTIEIKSDQHLFLYVTSGKIEINGKYTLGEKDQLRASDEAKITLKFLEKTDIIVIEST